MDTATPSRSFGAYELSADTLKSLEAKDYRHPTDVQHEAIPLAMEGKDLVVQSRTGTGKTAAFGVPIVEKIDLEHEGVQAVVLTPTRELAIQVAKEITELQLSPDGSRYPSSGTTTSRHAVSSTS